MTAQINILPIFGDKVVAENTWFVTQNGDSIQFNNIRFYLSNVQFVLHDKSLLSDTVKAHLVDVFDPQTLVIAVPKMDLKNIRKLRFSLGIDSITNVSGALSGDLDPMKGMYWAWQSGYINMKIEGISPKSPSRKNAFQYHIGGYLEPFYSMRTVELELENGFNSGKSALKIDFSKFFESLHIASQNSIMIPCKEAVQLANGVAKMFSIAE